MSKQCGAGEPVLWKKFARGGGPKINIQGGAGGGSTKFFIDTDYSRDLGL